MANKITTFFSFQEEGNGLKRIAKEVKEADGAINKLKVGIRGSIREFRQSNAAQAGAIAGLGAAAYQAIGLASDLEESVNAVTVTYGDNADAVLAIGENAAKSFGMTKTEFNTFAVQFSAFAKQVAEKDGREVSEVIQEMTTRVADFASVMNLDMNTAAQVFMSTMAGETEPIRRFGKDVSAAAVETYALANGLAETKSEIDESIKVQARYGLLMEQTADTAGDFANTSDSLANSQKIAAAQAKDLAAEIGGTLAPALGTVIQGLTGVMDALNAIGFDDAMRFIGELDVKSESFGRTIRRTFDGAADANWKYVESVEGAEAAVAEFDKETLLAAGSVDDARKIAEEYAATLDGDVVDAQHVVNSLIVEWHDANVEAAEAQAEAEKAALANTEALRDQSRAANHTATVLGENNRALDRLKGFAERAAQFVQSLGSRWDQLKRTMSDRSAFLDVEDAFDNVQSAAEASFAAAEAGSEDAERAARDLERAQIDLKNAVIDYGTEVGDLPDQVLTNIISLIDQGNLAEAEAALARLERARQVNYQPIVFAPRTPGGFRFMASGTNYAEGGPTVVGERGPEIVDMPRGARVRSATETITDSRGGGGTVNNTFNITAAPMEDPMYTIGRALRMARMTK